MKGVGEMIDRRLEISLTRLVELADNIRNVRYGERVTEPCDVLVSTTIKSDRVPTMEVTLGWLYPPQLAFEVDGHLYTLPQLSHVDMTSQQAEVLREVEPVLAAIWAQQTIHAPESAERKQFEEYRKELAGAEGREGLGVRGVTADSGGITAGGIVERGESASNCERGDYEIPCDDKSLTAPCTVAVSDLPDLEARVSKLETGIDKRLKVVERSIGELYRRTEHNKGAIEQLGNTAMDEYPKDDAVNVKVSYVTEAPLAIGENVWLDDLKQQLNRIGKTVKSDEVRIFRIFFGGVGREATEVLLYTRGDDMQLCLPGETFLKTTDEVRELLSADKLDQRAYWELLLGTLKRWKDAGLAMEWDKGII